MPHYLSTNRGHINQQETLQASEKDIGYTWNQNLVPRGGLNLLVDVKFILLESTGYLSTATKWNILFGPRYIPLIIRNICIGPLLLLLEPMPVIKTRRRRTSSSYTSRPSWLAHKTTLNDTGTSADDIKYSARHYRIIDK